MRGVAVLQEGSIADSQVMRSISIRFIYGERQRQPLMWCGATIARA